MTRDFTVRNAGFGSITSLREAASVVASGSRLTTMPMLVTDTLVFIFSSGSPPLAGPDKDAFLPLRHLSWCATWLSCGAAARLNIP